MPLSDLAIFSEQVYTTQTEVLSQQLELFNSATQGGMVLAAGDNQGSFSETAMFARVSGLIRRRDPFGSGAVDKKNLRHIKDVSVKVASGTPELELDPSQFKWIKLNPDVAGAVFGRQLAVETLADMVNTCLRVLTTALSNVDDMILDQSSAKLTQISFNNAQALYGDRYTDLLCWLMHSQPMFDIFGAALTNTEQLYTFGSVAVRRDAFGRPIVITDSPALINSTSPTVYQSLGLTAGAVTLQQNPDYTDNVDTRNGYENIQATYQAEWSYNLGVKGFRFNRGTADANQAPNDAKLADPDNWTAYTTEPRDGAGVMIYSL